ncbi:hypothetical protein NEDG_00162 [Nematocida displodere]|uniref:RFX-type winged-helix domain-containing protein n=1 Tax=Nematocida displodere TaxID=1805483 RepID=A0A177EIC8_9MICR|nr:hypothetical protein NEDG_00162 [Nematocida displodere]
MLKNMFIESMNQPITNWLNLNYTSSKDGSIPRCTIYQHYCEDFKREGIEPLNTAMFGKVIKMAFPFIRSRRLGNRGNSKYHYFGVAIRGSPLSMLSSEDSLSENSFLARYEGMQKEVLSRLLEKSYMPAYQELKEFWSECGPSLQLSKNVERMCVSVEKEMFAGLTRQYFSSEDIFVDGSVVIPSSASIVAAKTAAKTITILSIHVLSIIGNRCVAQRMESYKHHSMVLNSVANIYKSIGILEANHHMRDNLTELVSFMNTGMCVMREGVPLEKSHAIHACATSLISYFITASSFHDFISGVDEAVIAVLCKKERILYEEFFTYFSGLVQEIATADFAYCHLSIVLCTFFLEYFCIASSNAMHEPLFRTKAPSPLELSDKAASETKSFVSQIITQC